ARTIPRTKQTMRVFMSAPSLLSAPTHVSADQPPRGWTHLPRVKARVLPSPTPTEPNGWDGADTVLADSSTGQDPNFDEFGRDKSRPQSNGGPVGRRLCRLFPRRSGALVRGGDELGGVFAPPPLPALG